MKRSLSELSRTVYDVAIIGGGIYGACVARDAALRGLGVALVDQGDFGSATSANTHKIIHGGLRYLQHLDFKRMRESIRERNILMRIAPYLVHPMPFLIPTYKNMARGKLLMFTALKLNDLVGFDRNRHLDAEKFMPPARVISKTDCLRFSAAFNERGITGGAVFYDGQVSNPNRLILSILESAERAGAHLANYVQVTGFMKTGNIITGFKAKDVLTGNALNVRARIVVNCSGPWIDSILDFLGNRSQRKRIELFKAVVLVTRQLFDSMAVAVYDRSVYKDRDAFVNKGSRLFFIVPWRNNSLIGTFQVPHHENSADYKVTEEEIQGFIEEINKCSPAVGLKRHEIYFVNAGLLPRGEALNGNVDVQLMKQYQIRDHYKEEALNGLISVVGVKFTTARDVAEKATDLVLMKLGRDYIPSRTAMLPVHGGNMEQFHSFLKNEIARYSQNLLQDIVRHLIYNYGSTYGDVLQYIQEDSRCGNILSHSIKITEAEILHGIRNEMANKLTDVVFRRTELGTAGHPGKNSLKACAEIMGRELGWGDDRTHVEIEEAERLFKVGQA
jgi:glycerol-3-phosphate dehydrogenase